MARICRDDLPDGRSEIFFAGPLDRFFDGAPVGQITPSPMSYKSPVLINLARREVRYATHLRRNVDVGGGPRSADSVVKVCLHHSTQFFRAAGAAIEQSCEGLSQLTMNSLAISVTRLRTHRSAIVACFAFNGKLAARHFGTFANTICH
jgi:hypothetical protein